MSKIFVQSHSCQSFPELITLAPHLKTARTWTEGSRGPEEQVAPLGLEPVWANLLHLTTQVTVKLVQDFHFVHLKQWPFRDNLIKLVFEEAI
jgi:hypothetical protein